MARPYTIVIAEDFTNTPGARHISDGPFSGEAFYRELLKNKYIEAIGSGQKLTIVLDNVWGYPSFISGSFGRLRDDFGLDKILDNIIFISQDNPKRIEEIYRNLREQK